MSLTGSAAPSFAAVLLRGLLAGLLAGLVAGVVGYAVGEPRIDAAIAVEQQAAHAAGAASDDHHGDETVGRDTQRAGLLLATGLYGVAVGGLFATAYVLLRRRLRTPSDTRAVLALAGAALLGVVVVPFGKYPPNPPAVGEPGTVDQRTVSYLTLIVIGLVAGWAAALAWRSARRTVGEWLPYASAAAAFLAVVAVGYVALPPADAVPATFPAGLLWEFRLASLATQATLFAVLALAFAALLERLGAARRATPVPARG